MSLWHAADLVDEQAPERVVVEPKKATAGTGIADERRRDAPDEDDEGEAPERGEALFTVHTRDGHRHQRERQAQKREHAAPYGVAIQCQVHESCARGPAAAASLRARVRVGCRAREQAA